MRSSEHAAHRLLMHSGHISHLWLKVSPCVSFHVIHACALVCCSLSVSPHPSFYFLVLFLFQLYLMSNSAPDEFSIKDPLCNSSLGSMVTLDYVTPLTHPAQPAAHFLVTPCRRGPTCPCLRRRRCLFFHSEDEIAPASLVGQDQPPVASLMVPIARLELAVAQFAGVSVPLIMEDLVDGVQAAPQELVPNRLGEQIGANESWNRLGVCRR